MLLAATLSWRAVVAGGTAAGPGATRPIQITDGASRIISLAPSTTEQLFEIGVGDRVIGTSASSDFPPPALKIPVVSGPGGVDLERIAALHPDLVVLWGSGYPPSTRQALARLGVPVFVSEPASLESIARSMEQLGQLTDAPDALLKATQFRARLAHLREQYGGRRPLRAFYQVWAQPLMTLSGHHVVSEALRLCGARNIFSDLTALVPTVSPEAVIAADPEVILTSEAGGADHGALKFWQRYPFISAVANHQLLTLDANRIDRAAPRMLDEAQRMCELFDAARAAGAPRARPK